MFQKLVAIEPIRFDTETREKLRQYAKEVMFYSDLPQNNAEIIRRIGDADGVLVSFTTNLDGEVIQACPAIRYIGMCCSLYSPESANVDILTAEKKGITVLGIRDYGDEGVVEYAVSELVRLLHGFGEHQWRDEALELGGLKIGVIGMGTSGTMVSKALQALGGDIRYFSRTRKPEAEAAGFQYQPLEMLLKNCEIVLTCLNKNVILLHETEFGWLGNGKILMNTSISPSYDIPALKNWLGGSGNYYLCDSDMALGDGELGKLPNVICPHKTSGLTVQAGKRLCRKVLENIESFLAQNE